MLKTIFKNSKKSKPHIKFPRFAVVLFIFLLIGITILARSLVLQDENSKRGAILNRGAHLVSLIAMYPINHFKVIEQNIFFRTLIEGNSHSNIMYCFVHDRTGKVLASLVHNELASKMPNDVQMESLSTMGLTKQTFSDPKSGQTIYEFAKPIFEDSQKTGTVRLGFMLPPLQLLTQERIRLLAVFAFFMFVAAFIVYYVIIIAIRPLQNIVQDPKNIHHVSVEDKSLSEDARGIAQIIVDIDSSFSSLQDRMNRMKSDNIELVTRMGAISFEKNQIINLLDCMSFGIITIDIQDKISFMNSYMCTLLDKQLKEVLDQPLDNIIRDDEIVGFVSRQKTRELTKSVNHIETAFPDHSPGEVFSISLCNLQDNEGSVIGNMLLVKNITSEKIGEKTQQEFISHISHELLTPLTTIKSYNEMLMEDEVDNEEMQKEFYNTISKETTRLTRLVQDLLNISKIEMGKLTLNKGLIRTDLLFEDCVSAVNASALNKRITFDKKIPDKFPSLNGDKELLKVAINNILNNAVKYTPEEGSITFLLNDHIDIVTFDVVNTGDGISNKDIPHIFDKCYRSSDAHITRQSGTGLGLAIASEIVQLHGGEIKVQSEPGSETTFSISIPKEEYYIEDQ